MRIVQLVDHWSGGGVPAIIELIYDILETEGHEVRIISYRSSDFNPSISYRYESLKARFPGDPHAIYRLHRILSKFKPDIIHDHYGGLWSLSYLLCKKWRKRSILHVHNEYDVIEDSPDQSRPLRTRLFLKWILPLFSKVIAVSNSVKNTLTQIQPRVTSKVDVALNAINCEALQKQHALLSDEYQNLLQPYDLILGCVGRLVYEKGIDSVIEILSELRNEGINAGLIIVGDGDASYKKHLQVLCQRLGISDHCHMVGRQKEVFNWMRVMDLFVFASRQEPFGLTLIESMCAQTPVMALPMEQPGGPDEFLKHKHNALVLEHRNPKRAAQIIKECMDDEELLEQLRRGGEETLSQFGPQAYAKRLLPLYEELVHFET